MRVVKKISIRRWILLIGILMIPSICYARNTFETVYIGELETTPIRFLNKEESYSLYKIKGKVFIPISTLQSVGFSVDEKDGIYYIGETVSENKVQNEQITSTGSAYMAKYPVYCGAIRSYALVVNKQLLIPIEVLQAIGNLQQVEGNYSLEIDFLSPLKQLKIEEDGIVNLTDHILQLKFNQIYWNGKDYEQFPGDMFLEAGETKQWIQSSENQKLYITTLIEEINGWHIPESTSGFYGLQDPVILKQYSDTIYLGILKHSFPPCYIEGEMRYNVGGLKEKEKVEVCRCEKRYYFLVKDSKGNQYQVPYESVHILGEKGARYSRVSQTQIEDFATLSQIESATDYLVWTDLYRQRTYVLKREGEAWKLQKNFVSSTGKLNNPTPTGFYEVQYKIPYIGVQKGYRCKYAVVFFRDYMFHSILFDKTGQYIKSGQYELGSKASHGCVRLSEKDSKWLYDHVPLKTKVWIR